MKDDLKKDSSISPIATDKKWYKKSSWIAVFLIIFWPLGVYFMWRYANWKKSVKIVISALELLFFMIFMVGVANASPYISLADSYYSTPKTDKSSYVVSGTASPDSVVKVNEVTALRSGSDFKVTVPLKEGDNQINVVATDGDKQTKKSFVIHRNTSAEIKASKDTAAAAKKAAAVDTAKKAVAADAAKKATAADDAKKAAADAVKTQAAATAKAQKDAAAAAAAAKANAPAEYKSALAQATSYANTMHMSKQGVYDQLVSEYGGQFSAAAAQYGIDNVKSDWNANALAQAKTYQNTMHLSPNAIHDQLTSEYGEQFTSAEADYAIQHLND